MCVVCVRERERARAIKILLLLWRGTIYVMLTFALKINDLFIKKKSCIKTQYFYQ